MESKQALKKHGLEVRFVDANGVRCYGLFEIGNPSIVSPIATVTTNLFKMKELISDSKRYALRVSEEDYHQAAEDWFYTGLQPRQ